MNEGILMKMIIVSHYQVHMTFTTFRRSLGQRSRSQPAMAVEILWTR